MPSRPDLNEAAASGLRHRGCLADHLVIVIPPLPCSGLTSETAIIFGVRDGSPGKKRLLQEKLRTVRMNSILSTYEHRLSLDYSQCHQDLETVQTPAHDGPFQMRQAFRWATISKISTAAGLASFRSCSADGELNSAAGSGVGALTKNHLIALPSYHYSYFAPGSSCQSQNTTLQPPWRLLGV